MSDTARVIKRLLDGMADSPEFMSVGQVSKKLSLSVPTLRRMTATKAIPFYKIGRRILFEKTDIVEWLSNLRKPEEE